MDINGTLTSIEKTKETCTIQYKVGGNTFSTTPIPRSYLNMAFLENAIRDQKKVRVSKELNRETGVVETTHLRVGAEHVLKKPVVLG